MNSKLYNVIALIAVLAVGSVQANRVTEIISATHAELNQMVQENLPRFIVPGKDFVIDQAKNLYKDPKGAVTAVAGFAFEQGKNFVTLVDKNRLATAGVVVGLGATAVAAKYAAPHIKWAYNRTKINVGSVANKCVSNLKQNVVEPVKNAVVATAKFGWKATKVATKTAVIGAALASPVVAAYAIAHKETVMPIAQLALENAQEFVVSLITRA